MNIAHKSALKKLGLRPGQWVRVKSPSEILGTLDSEGRFEGVPFMPEMLNRCGSLMRVYKRSDKTCDTATKTGGRRMTDSVHLVGERCDGSFHGGCQAQCLNFWKEAWLEIPTDEASGTSFAGTTDYHEAMSFLQQKVSTNADSKASHVIRYSCQATLLPSYTTPLEWWDLRQYARDLWSNQVGLFKFTRIAIQNFYKVLLESGVGYRFWTNLYALWQRMTGGPPWPDQPGTLEKTPTGILDLKPGELVRIKSLEEITRTLDKSNKNKGMRFDKEMAKFCGKTFKVHSRVEKIINEGTGEMMTMKSPCIILENVWCTAEWSECRLFCPRSIYHYWREIWLERA